MRILIYGAGVIGSIFGGKLALAGHEITVLARGIRYEEIEKEGIALVHEKDQKTEQMPVRVIRELASDDAYDYILVTVQRTQVDEILKSLSRNCSRNIVFLVNTAGGYDQWAEAVGEEKLMIGFPAAGGERKEGKVFYFIGRGFQRVFQTTTLGEYSGRKTERVKGLIRIFNQAKIPSVYCRDMDAWQKTHVALVTNIANALYGFECSNYKLGKSYNDVRQMVLGIKEGRKVLRKKGIMPTPVKLVWLNLPSPLLTIIFSLFLRTRLAEITMARHCTHAIDEMVALQKEFDKLIAKSGLTTPEMNCLKGNLIKRAKSQERSKL